MRPLLALLLALSPINPAGHHRGHSYTCHLVPVTWTGTGFAHPDYIYLQTVCTHKGRP